MLRALALASLLGVVVGASVGGLGCGSIPNSTGPSDPMQAIATPPLGLDLLSPRWKYVTANRLSEIGPQEFATPIVWADTVYVGSAAGDYLALRASSGALRWHKPMGSVSAPAVAARGLLWIGTDDGELRCLDSQTGEERWRYKSMGPISQAPVLAGELVLFSNEADQLIALDALDGKLRWQYQGETPEKFTLRGHAGVTVAGDLVFSGFSDGTMVALRRDTGSVAWSAQLKGEADEFVDVDATPIILGDSVYVVSSSGGVWSLAVQTGQVQWRMPLDDASSGRSGGGGTLTTDGERLFVAAAELGIYAIDLDGNVLWRQGTRGGGEPATPIVAGDLVIYSLASDGVYLADRKTGELYEFFDPGDGISGAPAVVGGALYVLSNRGILYAFDLDQP